MVELLSSKLFIPPLRPNLVPRPRLVQLLHAGLSINRKLTLVSAPAGFGKTTLVAAWLKELDHPTAWLSLDEADNDLRRFLTYLAAAFQRADEEIGGHLLSALQSPLLPETEKILTALLNEIALRDGPLLLVLDDFHLLSEATVLQAVEFLLSHQPPQLHLVLTTREDPSLPLARLRARDQLTEIRAWNLRFTQEETDSFLRIGMGLELSRQDVAALEDRTEGWVAGLQLAGLSMQRQTDLQAFIADFSGSHRYILDYLTDEVLHQQPESIRSFLLHTAILDRLSGPLCDAVTGRNDSDKLLAQLEAANLFCIPLDEGRRWFRYHHLFSDLLCNQLTRSQPQLVPELHRRASRWYEENGDIHAAVEHALQGPDLTRAAALIEQHAMPKLYQGEVAKVVRWFDRLPEKALESAPMLCIAKAWALALMRRGNYTGEVDLALKAAECALDQVKAGETLRNLVTGHAACIQAFILPTILRGGKPEKLIALSQEARRLLPESEKAIRSVTALSTGSGYMALADLEAARIAYKQALEDGLAGGNFYAAIYGPNDLVLCALLEAQLSEALQLCETYIGRFNQLLAGQNFPPIGALYILKSCIFLEYNRLAEAEQVLTEGLDLVRWMREYDAQNKGYTTLARLRAIQGDQAAMLAAISSLEDAWPEVAIYAQALRHRLSIRHWPADPDVQRDAYTWLAQSGIKFGELEAICSLDATSEAYFESYLCAAHVLARLVKRKPDLYPIEDVQVYLKRQHEFAKDRGVVRWAVAVAIARTLLYQVQGRKEEALKTLEGALIAAAPTGLLRIFVDECDPLQALLEELKPRLTDASLIVYANRLLEAFSCGAGEAEPDDRHQAQLSDRELEVLHHLASGLTYEEIGQQLFLSLNTIQFHVKNIYSKLLVNKRVQAIEKARAMNLI